MGGTVTLVVSGVMVVVYLATFQGLAILSTRSMVTSDLRSATEQLGRDVTRAQDAPGTAPAICNDLAPSAVLLVLTGPLPGVGGPGFDCIIYTCQPSPGVIPGLCNNANPNADPSTLGTLQRRVYSDAGGGNPVELRTMARGVFSLGFSRNGAPVKRVDVRLGVRQRIQRNQAQGQLVTIFNLRNN